MNQRGVDLVGEEIVSTYENPGEGKLIFFSKLAFPVDHQEGNVIVLGRFASEGKYVRGDVVHE